MRTSKNKILITGATSGIGLAMVEHFLKLDNEIIAVARNKKKLKELEQIDSRITSIVCDISNHNELDNLLLTIQDNHQDLNILINNAGIQYNYLFTEESELLAKIEYEININFTAPLRLVALLLPTLQRNENSAIVNVSSGLGLVPKKQAPVYCGTKAGIHVFSKSLRYQLNNTKVFEIIPPLVDTQMTYGRGKNKMAPDKLVNEFIKGFENDKYEMKIGKVKLLRVIQRLSPKLADRIINKGSES